MFCRLCDKFCFAYLIIIHVATFWVIYSNLLLVLNWASASQFVYPFTSDRHLGQYQFAVMNPSWILVCKCCNGYFVYLDTRKLLWGELLDYLASKCLIPGNYLPKWLLFSAIMSGAVSSSKIFKKYIFNFLIVNVYYLFFFLTHLSGDDVSMLRRNGHILTYLSYMSKFLFHVIW